MELGCIVVCDKVRIESFRLRIKVDELDNGGKNQLTGLRVIKNVGYRIPVNHEVLLILKGDSVDLVIT